MYNKRIHSLDSLRGLASLTVVFHHSMLALPLFYLAYKHDYQNKLTQFITNSPIHMLWGGHEAVLLFFVLSGFVLSIPFLNNKPFTYKKYIIKRFCRIYIPYIVSIFLSYTLFYFIQPHNLRGMSDNFNEMWSHSIDLYDFFSYLFMLGAGVINLNGVTWSLVHEMRISFFFPLLMIFIVRLNWKKSVFIGGLFFLFLWTALTLTSELIRFKEMSDLILSFAETFYYTPFFIIGACLAKYKDSLINTIKMLSNTLKLLLIFLVVVLYNFEWMSFGFGGLKYKETIIPTRVVSLIVDYTVVLGVSILLILILSSYRLTKLLNVSILQSLGKVSYSLYLIHMIIMLTLVHLFNEEIPTILLLMLSPFISVISSYIFYYMIEKNSIKIGIYLTNINNEQSSSMIHYKKID
ncbi:acyltransferase [Exiguobacterium acetylicum]|uniref:acyltransferase family protein n=1 Tax=Exiguobacterium acetylicum TaxID=41170 RepID=UPI0039773FF3